MFLVPCYVSSESRKRKLDTRHGTYGHNVAIEEVDVKTVRLVLRFVYTDDYKSAVYGLDLASMIALAELQICTACQSCATQHAMRWSEQMTSTILQHRNCHDKTQSHAGNYYHLQFNVEISISFFAA